MSFTIDGIFFRPFIIFVPNFIFFLHGRWFDSWNAWMRVHQINENSAREKDMNYEESRGAKEWKWGLRTTPTVERSRATAKGSHASRKEIRSSRMRNKLIDGYKEIRTIRAHCIACFIDEPHFVGFLFIRRKSIAHSCVLTEIAVVGAPCVWLTHGKGENISYNCISITSRNICLPFIRRLRLLWFVCFAVWCVFFHLVFFLLFI